MTLKVLLVDKSEIVREGLAKLIAGDKQGIEIETCSTDSNVVEKTQEFKADIILISSETEYHWLVATTQRIFEDFPSIKILILSNEQEQHSLWPLIISGCSGCISRNDSLSQILQAITIVNEGALLISSKMLRRMLSELTSEGALTYNGKLSDREKEVLKLVSEGATNKQVAEALYISPNTVKVHVRNIMEKLHVGSRLRAVVTSRIRREAIYSGQDYVDNSIQSLDEGIKSI